MFRRRARFGSVTLRATPSRSRCRRSGAIRWRSTSAPPRRSRASASKRRWSLLRPRSPAAACGTPERSPGRSGTPAGSRSRGSTRVRTTGFRIEIDDAGSVGAGRRAADIDPQRWRPRRGRILLGTLAATPLLAAPARCRATTARPAPSGASPDMKMRLADRPGPGHRQARLAFVHLRRAGILVTGVIQNSGGIADRRRDHGQARTSTSCSGGGSRRAGRPGSASDPRPGLLARGSPSAATGCGSGRLAAG